MSALLSRGLGPRCPSSDERLSVELASLALERMRALDDLQFFGTSSLRRASQVCTSVGARLHPCEKNTSGNSLVKASFLQ
jgi:hypothetical protein